MKKRRESFFSVVLMLLSMLWGVAPMAAQQHEPIEHEVSVSRLLLPLFAYDRNGKPVYDLKKEELSLTIDGKPVAIETLNRIDFEYDSETTVQKTRTIKEKLNQRVIFLVIDTMYNSFYGIKRAKKIAKKMIRDDSFGSEFVIMHNSRFEGGLKLILGPESNKKKLYRALNKIARLPDFQGTSFTRNINNRTNSAYRSPTGEGLIVKKHKRVSGKIMAKFFLEFLAQLKYCIETIDQPKMIFVLSEGIPEYLFYEPGNASFSYSTDSELFDRIKRLVKAINDAGSFLYTIHSGRPLVGGGSAGAGGSGDGGKSTDSSAETSGSTGLGVTEVNLPFNASSGVESLKAIAVGSGGQFFDGTVDYMVKSITNTTSAYYEISVKVPDTKKEMSVDLKCKRKGIILDHLVKTRIKPNYSEMKNVQKKVFAFNVALERNWTQMKESASKVTFEWKVRDNNNNNKKGKNKIAVSIPREMNGKNVDVFLIRFNEDFSNPHVSLNSKVAAGTEEIEFKKVKDGQRLYFVIVEPQSSRSIYSRVL